VTPLAGGYVVTVRLVDAATGDGLASFRQTIDGPGELLPTLDKLSGDLRGKIGESLKRVRANPPLERVTTSSLDALRKYAEGMRAFDIEGDNAKAVGFFREAVAIDTAFGMAYRKLGVALGNAGMPRASRDSALEAAYRHRFRMTDVERLLTTGSYFSSGKHFDRRLSVEAYEALLRIDSLNFAAINNLAIHLIEWREFARAESMMRRAIEQGISRAALFVNLGDALVRHSKFAAADSMAALARERFPQNASVRALEVFILTGRRQFDSLEKRAAWFKANDPDASNRSSAAFVLRDVAYIRGRIADGLRLEQDAIAIDEARGSPPGTFTRALDSSWVYIRHLEQRARGLQGLDAALARRSLSSVPIGDRRYVDFAIVYSLGGRPDRARQILAGYDSEDSAYRRRNQPSYHMALGEIALAEGRPVDAIREFRLGDRAPDGPRDSCIGCTYYLLSRAFDAAGMRDSAIAAYTTYVTAPSPFTWPDEFGLARAHHRLGELYEAKGDVSRARRHYEMFVELWKNADPELQPKVAAVRARLAALQKR
jgi:tetratricopeptide (TPR) repeat protein